MSKANEIKDTGNSLTCNSWNVIFSLCIFSYSFFLMTCVYTNWIFYFGGELKQTKTFCELVSLVCTFFLLKCITKWVTTYTKKLPILLSCPCKNFNLFVVVILFIIHKDKRMEVLTLFRIVITNYRLTGLASRGDNQLM